MNRYPRWKSLLIVVITAVGILYALPNLYGKDPALQISASRAAELGEATRLAVAKALEQAGIRHGGMDLEENNLLVRFQDEESQIKAQEMVKQTLGRSHTVALNLAPATPHWLRRFGAEPMFLGLDLRGGVHFLMQVDMAAAVAKAEERHIPDLEMQLREHRIPYQAMTHSKGNGVLIRFGNAEHRRRGMAAIADNFPDLALKQLRADTGEYPLSARLHDRVTKETRRLALQQNITTLRKRVNELGVAEPVIQQQGLERIVVQLPGVQDTARAKDVLGATATLEVRMTDQQHSVQEALDGQVPAGARLYRERDGTPVLLRTQVMLTGDQIINAASGFDSESGEPQVSITLDNAGGKRFSEATAVEVGRNMAVVFIENRTVTVENNTEKVRRTETIEEVISIATIQEQLGKRFRITGLDSPDEARDLALLLRAGALAAPIEIVEERTVGPSLGQDNIDQGFRSVKIGFILVLLFMAIWYKWFGLAANVALVLNLVLLIALLSLLQATLTLPGIAGIVLTVGMAVDANVLIFQRIREELGKGNSPRTSIHAGYEKAFITIADANITTLFAAIVLFSFGTGPIKGFAVTLSLGIVCSMFTAIMVTRFLVSLVYGGRKPKQLAI